MMMECLGKVKQIISWNFPTVSVWLPGLKGKDQLKIERVQKCALAIIIPRD